MPKKRELRQQEAAERQEARNKRTPEQQLAKLDAGGYTAHKEREKLRKMIDGTNES